MVYVWPVAWLHMALQSHFPFLPATTPAGDTRIETPPLHRGIQGFVFGLTLLAIAVPTPAAAFSVSEILDTMGRLTSGVANAASSVPSVTNIPALKAALNKDPDPVKAGDLAITGGTALTPASGPVGTIADVADATSAGAIALYVVRPGDTIGAIAAMYGVSVNTIIWANDLGYKGTIRPGDSLIILPVTGVEYTTKKGDTLQSVAKKFKADADEIAQFNGIDPAAPLAVGIDLVIPNGEIAAPPTQTSVQRRAATVAEPLIGGGGPLIPGYYLSPVSGGVVTQSLHGWNAVDIGAPKGTPVVAAAAGTVIIARADGWNGGLGSYVVIAHGNGTQTLYAHASQILVSVGQSVAQGQTIMRVGSTGLSTGPHVHFEVRGATNPEGLLPVGTRI